MRRVEQRQYGNGDCGVACVDIVSGKPYKEVEEAFHEHGLVVGGEHHTMHKHLIAVLKAFGYQVVRRRFTNLDNVEFPSIVKVNVRSGNYWHWVVMADKRKIFDPKPSSPEIVSDC